MKIGDEIHVHLSGEPDSECRPAKVVRVWDHKPRGTINAVVFLDGSNDQPPEDDTTPAPLVAWATSLTYNLVPGGNHYHLPGECLQGH